MKPPTRTTSTSPRRSSWSSSAAGRACARRRAGASSSRARSSPSCAGEAGGHQLVNRTEETVRFLAFSTSGEPDVVIYPDSGKVGAFERLPRGRRAAHDVPPRRHGRLLRRGAASERRLRPRPSSGRARGRGCSGSAGDADEALRGLELDRILPPKRAGQRGRRAGNGGRLARDWRRGGGVGGRSALLRDTRSQCEHAQSR